MSSKNKKASIKSEPKRPSYRTEFVFGKNNYRLMMIGLAVIALGFVLMYGGKENIYSTMRITIAPIVVIAGFVIEVFAALVKPVEESTHEPD